MEDCVCGEEGEDIHSVDPPLPDGWFWGMKRQKVGGQSGFECRWICAERGEVIEERGIVRHLENKGLFAGFGVLPHC